MSKTLNIIITIEHGGGYMDTMSIEDLSLVTDVSIPCLLKDMVLLSEQHGNAYVDFKSEDFVSLRCERDNASRLAEIIHSYECNGFATALEMVKEESDFPF